MSAPEPGKVYLTSVTTTEDLLLLRRLVDALEALVIVQAERLSSRQVQLSEMSGLVQGVIRKVATNAGYGPLLQPETVEDNDDERERPGEHP